MAVYRWSPSVLEISPRTEVVVPFHWQDQTAALKQRISVRFKVSLEKIELTEVQPCFFYLFIS